MPRRRPARVAVVPGILLAGCVAFGALAQTQTPTPTTPTLPSLLRPEVDGDRKDPPRFRRPGTPPQPVPGAVPITPGARAPGILPAVPKAPPRNPRRPGELPKLETPKFGDPPGSGAGTGGFVSVPKSKAEKAKQERERAERARTARGRAARAEVRPFHTVFQGIPTLTPLAGRDPPALRIRSDPPTEADRMAAALTLRRPPSSPDVLLALRRLEPDPFAPIGVRVGNFILRPAVELTTGYDNNPSRAPQGGGSWLFFVAPELLVNSDWTRHELRGELKGTYYTYPTYNSAPSLNRPFVDNKVFGRVDVTRDTKIIGEGRFLLSTDNPGSPNLQAGLARFPIYTQLGATLGYVQAFNRFEFTVKSTVDRTVYQQSFLQDGTTSPNDDRDFNQYGGSLRGSFEMTPGLRPFVEAGADSRHHDLSFDRSGLMRDSIGIVAKAGTTFELSRILVGEFAVGYLNRRYKDPTLPDLGGLTVDGSLTWFATPLTTFKLTAATRVDESILEGVSGSLTRDFGLQIDHALRRWLIGTAKVGYGIDDYVGSPRIDQRFTTSLALLYKLTREVQLKGELRREWLRSNIPGNDYNAEIILFGVRLQR